ncbi:MAG: ABC transporter substrate-binding protein [Sporichthyaceae bacterium]
MTPRFPALAVPGLLGFALLISACGAASTGSSLAAQAPAAPVAAAPELPAVAPERPAASSRARVPASPVVQTPQAAAVPDPVEAPVRAARAADQKAPAKQRPAGQPPKRAKRSVPAAPLGASDVGITKDSIKLGSINMHGMAFGSLIIGPMVRGNLATAAAINDRGGVLGRRLSIVDCDDGAGEVSRSKPCVKKLVTQDRIFALVGGATWATAALHDDLKQYRLPHVGSWAYSQTEWQNPFMFPTHMSMIHEAMAGANWARNVVKPKTYGLLCLTSPEMQLACNEVSKILDASGAKLVKKADIPISETTMSSYVLAMRAANPEHLVHYVINPATIAKFVVEAKQQGYYPPKGISGNHLAAEVLGSVFGEWAVGRYWTNTTYRLWGSEFMATMAKYARANRGANHHIVQTGYVGVNLFASAAKEVGANLTRDRLVATLANGTVWKSDASLDQRFQYTTSERGNSGWNRQYGQGREFMYKYVSPNTRANPDGSANGWELDPDQGVIYTWR